MKIQTRCIINTGTYQHIECDIEIDTDAPEKAQELIRFLHYNYFGILQTDSLEAYYQAKEANKEVKQQKWLKPRKNSELTEKKKQEFIEELADVGVETSV